MQKLINDVWTDSTLENLVEGDDYRLSVGDGGWQRQIYLPEKKEDTERRWRDSELLRTDELVKLPDYPIDLLPYRTALRDYPEQPDFPNGQRPAL